MIFVGPEAEFAYLAHFPTHYFSKLIDKWNNSTIKLEPNGLLSSENQETTIRLLKNMKESKLKQLRKFADILNISTIWWEVYQLSTKLPLSHLQKRQKTFNVEKYSPEAYSRIRGCFSTKKISEYAILILIEFSSRSTLLRRMFRYIYFPSINIILLEPKDLSRKILDDEILPFITNEPNKVKQKTIRAREIRSLTKTRSGDDPSFTLTRLKIKISLETSGIEGLNQIIIQGDNVIRGVETLEQRHEISLKFMNSGPWIGAGTRDFMIEVGKGIQIHQLEEKSIKNVVTVLSWL